MTQATETYTDKLLGFTIPGRDARGKAVRLDRTVDAILAAHDYPPAITHLLAEALVLATLTGGLLKDESGQLTMQAQTEGGVVRLLVCDYRDGALRGYVDFDRERLARLGANPSLEALFGEGYLAITFDMSGGRGRYQGVVPLEGESLAEACESYFAQSEQVPTLIRVAARAGHDGCVAGGLLIQHLADGEEGRERLHVRMDHPEWEHVAVMAGSTRHEELVDPGLSLEALVWRLFHEESEVRIQPGPDVLRGCRCSADHYRQVLGRFPEEDRADMRDANGKILVDCAFCSKVFEIEA
ncbi:Hsp33 family molecular chaperone HslO [Pelagerythrobacter marinus]|uniref:Hsp33 family molecular chaperone HslO n=1 Tax=Pelagerythrobacter marinus TaxID=538382 RepID=UPI00203767BA|nr:Hsp33 family molecular chaperone HslO [Pelagerythrobacter marinus]USA39035.1 Hsp33 family molecular chaperone HslO [Pelagerythrobacter marinus]WPZ06880.1 Hsp33 family molecular chaperone HslO [Pelagerythrobacter marinus]